MVQIRDNYREISRAACFCPAFLENTRPQAGIAQLVERNLAKVEVASSNLVSRSIFPFSTRSLSAVSVGS